jgi:hypothetical protein
MFYLIYKITNKINGKYYVGAHKTDNKNDDYMGSGVNITNAIRKYGIKNFDKEILFECSSEDEMYAKEKDTIILCDESYNIHEGGLGGWNYVNTSGLNNKSNQCIKAGKLGGKRCYEMKQGIHSPSWIRPPQKKIVEDVDMINAYIKEKNISKALMSLGLSRTGGSRRRMERLIAPLDQLE